MLGGIEHPSLVKKNLQLCFSDCLLGFFLVTQMHTGSSTYLHVQYIATFIIIIHSAVTKKRKLYLKDPRYSIPRQTAWYHSKKVGTSHAIPHTFNNSNEDIISDEDHIGDSQNSPKDGNSSQDSSHDPPVEYSDDFVSSDSTHTSISEDDLNLNSDGENSPRQDLVAGDYSSPNLSDDSITDAVFNSGFSEDDDFIEPSIEDPDNSPLNSTFDSNHSLNRSTDVNSYDEESDHNLDPPGQPTVSDIHITTSNLGLLTNKIVVDIYQSMFYDSIFN